MKTRPSSPSLLVLGTAAALLAVGLTPLASVAQQAGPSARPGIAWLTHPAVAAQPGEVLIELVVENFASTATGAGAANALSVQRVVHALSGSGIPIAGIESRGTLVVPEYAWRGPISETTIRDDRRIAGYRAMGGLSLRTTDVARVGLLLDLARGAGATLLEAQPFQTGGAR